MIQLSISEIATHQMSVCEPGADYSVDGIETEDDLIAKAREILAKRFSKGRAITSPAVTKDHLIMSYSALECEVFGVLWLDSKHRIIKEEILFRGTIDSAWVPVREIVKDALSRNASAAIVFHNHPSGISEPSQADRKLTEAIYNALNLVGVKLLDHMVIGANETTSFAEIGALN